MAVDLATSFCGLAFRNPIIVPAGVHGMDGDVMKAVGASGVAGICTKTIVSRPVARPPAPRLVRLPPFPIERMKSRYHFHFVTANRPGIWALVTTVCADNGINIESVHPKWEDRTKPSDL